MIKNRTVQLIYQTVYCSLGWWAVSLVLGFLTIFKRFAGIFTNPDYFTRSTD